MISPIGDERKDYHMAYLATLISNIMISLYSKEKNPNFDSIEDHFPKWRLQEKKNKKQTMQEMKSQLFNMVQVFKGNKKLTKRNKK